MGSSKGVKNGSQGIPEQAQMSSSWIEEVKGQKLRLICSPESYSRLAHLFRRLQSALQMATSRSSNLSRAAYRRRCRKILSEHICDIRPTAVERILLTKTRAARLGISIEPAEVRLITGADDPYAWQALPEKNHIFQKQLSKHSVGVYTEMCREVSVSFEAVPAPESKTAAERSPIEGTQRMLPVSSKTSFTSVI